MPRLFTYTIPVDDGVAPIRFAVCAHWRFASLAFDAWQEGDSVAGLGSKDAPSGDLNGHLVYAMRVDAVLTLKEYDEQAPTEWPTAYRM